MSFTATNHALPVSAELSNRALTTLKNGVNRDARQRAENGSARPVQAEQ